MDLVSSVKKIICVMPLTDKYGEMKFKKSIDLPVTGPKCVTLLISDIAVFEFTPNGVILKEISKDTTLEKVRAMTDVEFQIIGDLELMEDNSSIYAGEVEEDIFA